jgi:hypothetical protein
MTPALVCGKHLLDPDHGLLRDITFSQHGAGVGRLSDGLGVGDAPRRAPTLLMVHCPPRRGFLYAL